MVQTQKGLYTKRKYMNKFDKNLQMIEDQKPHICANCLYGKKEFFPLSEKDYICEYHNKNVLNNHSCDKFSWFVKINKEMINDPINPNHYKQGKLTCDEVCKAICANKTGIEAAYVFNIAKYIYRYNMKDGIKDVRKAREYCEMLIKHLEEKELKDE
jgi:hypothetical protein